MTASKLSQRLSGGIPPAALGKDDPAAAAAKTSLLANRMKELPARGEDVVLPVIGPVYLQLLGHTASNRVEAATFKAMADEGLPPIALHAWSYDVQRQGRTLAQAIRSRSDHDELFGPEDEWLKLDDDLLFACGRIYADVKERLDPVGAWFLSPETADRIAEDFKKKDASSLRSHGVASLVTWLLSGAVQLSNSQTAASSTSPSDSPDE